MWPTKSGRPLRRATFAFAASFDPWLRAYRRSLRGAELGEIDWLLHRANCNPYRPGTWAHHAYEKGFARERAATPSPSFDALPDIPRARRAPPIQETDHHEEP